MNKGGFDIVLANPPYVNTKKVNKKLKSKYKEIYGIKDDLYNYFFLKSFDILKEKGILSFISSNTYLTINSKINLRRLFQKNKVIELIKTDNVFENVKVEPAIITVKKENTKDYNYNMIFKNAIGNFDEPKRYIVDIDKYRKVVNQVFFEPTKFNLDIYRSYRKNIKNLYKKWWDKIRTSRKISKYSAEIKKYRNSLKPGDITLLGLITDGGQGLATANNGRFIGLKKGTKQANKIKKSRPKKLFKAIQDYDIETLSDINSKKQAQKYLDNLGEKEIRKLFDKLKKEYDRDMFGRGYLFRIIKKNEIANIENLDDKEKKDGIPKNKPHYVLYDKGDKYGNRWYLNSPYYIDWNKEKVKFLKNNSGKSGKGMPVVRNLRFYFREGFCWSDIHTLYIKSRIKLKSIHDVKSMSLFSQMSNIPDWYFVCILNSKFISKYVFDFINNTQTFQMNDARQVPIIIPNKNQLEEFKEIFDKAFFTKKKQFSGKLSTEEAQSILEDIQKTLDEKVNKLYGIQ